MRHTNAGVLAAALLLAATGVRAQDVPRRAVRVLLTHSMTSGTSAHGAACPCPESGDVLAPVSLSSLEFEVAWTLWRGGGWGVEYPIRAVPLALVRNNPTAAARLDPHGRGWVLSSRTPRDSTVGLGIKPLGIRGWAGSDRVGLEGEVSSGFFHFGTPLLAANGTQFNFVIEVGIGLRVDLPGRGGTVIGYKWHHLSNAGFGEVNPGLDSGVLYVAFRFD
jgi:hypothetical protein